MNEAIISINPVSSVAVGDIGMPGGFWGITAKTAETLFYFFGMMLNAIASMAVTALDIGSTIRDLGASIAQGNVIGVVLNALSLVPVLGALEGASDLVKTAQKWLDAFPSKADEVLGFLSGTILKHLPDWIGGKLLGLVSDAPVSKLVDEGIPVEDIVKYSDEVDFQKVLELRSQGVSPADIRYYVENDIDLGLVSKLRTKNIPASTIRRYADEGIDLKKVKRLRSKGLSPRATKYAVLKGADSQTIFKLQSQGIPTKKILQYFDEGADLKAVSKLRSQGIPVSHIDDYVEDGIWLKGVSKLQSLGRLSPSPKTTKKMLKTVKYADELDKFKVTKGKIGKVDIPNKVVRKINKRIAGTHRFSEKAIFIAAVTVNYQGWKDARQDSRTRNQNRSAKRPIRGYHGAT